MADEEKLDRITWLLEDIRARVFWLEQATRSLRGEVRRPLAPPVQPPPEPPARAVPPPPESVRQQPPPQAPRPQPQPSAPPPRIATPPPRVTLPSPPPMTLKEITEWVGLALGYVGIAAVFVGIAYFLHWSVTEQRLTAETAVGCGVFAGLLMLAFGEAARPNYRGFAHELHGGGLALIYVTLYFGWLRYHTFSDLGGVVTTSAVTAAAMAFALWRAAPVTAVLAAVGGFTTALLLGVAEGRQTLFLTYLLVLNAGVLLSALWKRWTWLTVSALLGTGLCVLAHIAGRYPTGLPGDLYGPFFLFMTGYFIEFVAATLVPQWREEQHVTEVEIVVLVLATLFYFGATSFLMFIHEPWKDGHGAFAFLLGLAMFGLASVTERERRTAQALRHTLNGLGLGLLTLAIPLQFGGPVLPALWAVEACVLFTMGSREERRPALRWLGLGAWLLMAGRIGLIDTWVWEWRPWVGERFLALLVGVAASGFIAVRYNRIREPLSENERTVRVIMVVCANAFGLMAVSWEVSDHCSKLLHNLWLAQALVGAVWALWGLAAVWVGLARSVQWVWIAGLCLFGVAAGKLLFVDLPRLGPGYLALSFSVIGVLLLVAAWRYLVWSRESQNRNEPFD